MVAIAEDEKRHQSWLGICTIWCSIWVGIMAIVIGWAVYTVPRHYHVNACDNYVDPLTPTLPGLPFKCGWHELRPKSGIYAFIQPNGSWFWNNAGYIQGKTNKSGILIDTHTDTVLTRNMLEMLPGRVPGDTIPLNALIYTHPDVDHILGDQEVPRHVPRYGRSVVNDEFIAASKIRATLLVASAVGHYIWGIAQKFDWRSMVRSLPSAVKWPALKLLGWAKVQSDCSKFNFQGLDRNLVVGVTNEISDKTLDLEVEDVGRVTVHHFGPIHSKSDSAVLVPRSKVCFTGDLLFVGIAAPMWVGTARAWVDALDALLAMTGDGWIFVPGHGPPTDAAGVRLMRSYFAHLDAAVTELCGATAGDPAADGDCARRVLRGLPAGLRAPAFAEPRRVLISAQIERMSRRTGGITKVDLGTKVRLLTEQGVENVLAML